MEELKALMAATRIMYVRQPSPRGLGDAVLHAEGFVGTEPFAVLLGDDLTVGPPCAAALRATHEKLGGSAIALEEVPADRIGRYGMAVGKEVEPGVIRLEDIVEKPSPDQVRSHLATIGRYVLSPEIIPRLRKTEAGKGREVQLTDAIRALMASEDVYGVRYRGRRYDVGDKLGWLIANLELGMERKDLRAGLRAFVDTARKGP